MAVNIGRREFAKPNGKLVGWFRPTGALRPNRTAWSSEEPMQAARLFVGFNVKDVPTWSMGELVGMVKEIRKEQGAAPDSSFVAQKGLYAHQKKQGLIVEEDGAQVIILNVADTPPRKFEREVEELTAKLAAEMEQESIILEFQQGGAVYRTLGIEA